MRQHRSIELFGYWNHLRNGRAAPRRTEIEPAEIKVLLPDTFILESVRGGEAVFRLAGTRICATFGRELKGCGIASLWRQHDHAAIAGMASEVLQSKLVAVAAFDGISRNRRHLSFEMLLLPLEGGAERRRCIGIMSASENPFWLGSDPLIECRVISIRHVNLEYEPSRRDDRPAISVPAIFKEEFGAEQLDPAEPEPRRIRHLIVHEGGRE
jgi:hypothetical protein